MTLKSTEIGQFKEIFTGRRRRLLKSIKYRVVLPTYGDVSCGRFERELDREKNNEAFTNALGNLFCVLASWEDDLDGLATPYSVELEINDVYSPKDNDHRTRPVVIGRPGDLRSTRYKYSYIEIKDPSQLPSVPGISVLRTRLMNRRLSAQTAIHIAGRLPNLRVIDMYAFDDERRYNRLRLQNRIALGQALESVGLPQSLQEISLKLDHGRPQSHPWEPPSLWLDDQCLDIIGNNLRKATSHCRRLTKLQVEGVVDWALLWPDSFACETLSLSPSVVTPFWQSLEELTVSFALASPSGGWYFRGGDNLSWPVSYNELPPGHGFTEEQDLSAAFQYDDSTDQVMSGLAGAPLFRTRPRTGELQPLIAAFALVCAQIPTLKTARISSEVWNGGIDTDPSQGRGWHPWGIWYTAPGSQFSQIPSQDLEFSLEASQRRLVFDIGDWQPNPRLLTMLRNIGKKQHGDSLSELFLDHNIVAEDSTTDEESDITFNLGGQMTAS